VIIFALFTALMLAPVRSAAQSQVANHSDAPTRPQDLPQSDVALEIKGTVKVTVQADKVRGFMAPRALGMASSIGDNHLMDPLMPQILMSAGVSTLRYPGGAYSDNYHWSTYKPTKTQASDPPQYAYYAEKNDFAHLVALMEQFGTSTVTVNYGSNLDGSAGGTPQEAAAWVAYAMGDPANQLVIGKDASGHDWQTVSYWASLRASQPLPTDDGLNFLRIGHPAWVPIKYWEVGTEVYQNGYYAGQAQEEDLHAPYAKDPKDNEKQRAKNPNLSPDAYGKALLEYSKAMKAVDPRIKVGASLDIPLSADWSTSDWLQDPITKKWVQKGTAEAAGLGVGHKDFNAGVDWDQNVLKVAGKDIDFVALHWYVGDTTEASHWQSMDNTKTLMEPEQGLPKVLGALVEMIQKYCGKNASNMQVLMTEMGIKSYIKIPDPIVPALFASDAYATLIEDGVANIDWADMRKDGFLDDDNKPGPIYFAMQMVRQMAGPNDNFVSTSSSNSLLAVHAYARKDGKIGIMLINKDPKNNATVKLNISGANLATTGTRFDFGKNNPGTQYMVPPAEATGLGNSFTVTVPSYTITDLVIPLVPKQ
jgi:alpha-L-arabinofuranosidase